MVLPIAVLKNNICKTSVLNTTKLLLKGMRDYKKEESK